MIRRARLLLTQLRYFSTLHCNGFYTGKEKPGRSAIYIPGYNRAGSWQDLSRFSHSTFACYGAG